MDELLEQVKKAYRLGEQLYSKLLELRPADTDIIISPKHIGDTIWLCAFVREYKEQHDCKCVMMVVSDFQNELVSFFPSVDFSLPLSRDNITALRIYIGLNELWKQPHIVYAHFPIDVVLTKNGVRLKEIIETRSMLIMNRQFMDLGSEAMPERMTMPDKPFSEEYQQRYRNAVMLMPGVNSMDGLPKEFWETLAQSLLKRGIEVFSNYNGVACEYVVEGTEPISSTFSEMVEFCRYFKAFIGARSGICDLVAGTEATLVCLWPTFEKGTGIELHPVQKDFGDLSAVGRPEGIYNFQYQEELEEVLLEQILRCIHADV